MSYVLLGVVMSLNFILVIWKFKHDRTLDAIVDGSLLAVVFMVFSGSTELLIIGTIGSFIISIYLLFSPVKLSHANA